MWQQGTREKDFPVLYGAKSRYVELYRKFVMRQGVVFVNQGFEANGLLLSVIFVAFKLSLSVSFSLKTASIASIVRHPC